MAAPRRHGVDRIAKLILGIMAVVVAPLLIAPMRAYPEPDGGTAAIAALDSLGLEECLSIALANSFQIAISEGNVEKAEIGVKDAKAAFLPELRLLGGYYIGDTYSSPGWNPDYYSLSLAASVTPFNGGKNFINTAKSRESLSSARQSRLLAETDLILEVMARYYGLLEASEILELRKESLDQKKTHLEFARAQYDLGLVPKSDVLKAEVAVLSGEVDLVEADGNLGIARTGLNDAMGIGLENSFSIEPVDVDREDPPGTQECLEEAFRNRPEILRQKSSVTIGEYNVKLARVDVWPKLTVVGSYNAYVDRFVFDGLPLDKTNWDDNSDWRVGIGLSFPLFDGGITRRAVQSARIDLEQAELDYLDLERQVNLEVKSAHLGLVTALKTIDVTEKEVESAQESYDAALGRYETGVAPITEVIDAAVALSESKVGSTRAVYTYLQARADLKQAMGRSPY
jgi:outer membrane protein TolC